jgi:multidrug efflux pump subunit AcrB
MKITKSFSTSNEQEINDYLKENEDKVANGVINVSPNQITILTDTDQLTATRLSNLNVELNKSYANVDNNKLNILGLKRALKDIPAIEINTSDGKEDNSKKDIEESIKKNEEAIQESLEVIKDIEGIIKELK